TDDTFTYQVTYTDNDGDAPSFVRVYIDGSPHNMAQVNGTYTDGVTYHYITSSLSIGSHNYYFSASDHTDTDRLPKNGTYSGPIIKENRATKDTDGDGMSDMWENQYRLNQNDPSDASMDPDGDGYTNLQECQAGTNPNDTTSHPTATLAAKIPIIYIVVVVPAIVIVVGTIMVLRKR
ncbi:MAG: thrombospondin type 3 repeat-containing protein, partial [Candidatus Hodarchaeota archaeon]